MRRILIDNHETELNKVCYGFPWRSDAICFNFNFPEELVLLENVGELNGLEEIETLVIGCDLENYDFISNMVNLRQLYIYSGKGVKDVSFVEKLIKMQQLYIVASSVVSLDGIFQLLNEKEKLHKNASDWRERMYYSMEGICIDSDHPLLEAREIVKFDIHIGELIINQKRIRYIGEYK